MILHGIYHGVFACAPSVGQPDNFQFLSLSTVLYKHDVQLPLPWHLFLLKGHREVRFKYSRIYYQIVFPEDYGNLNVLIS